MYPPELFAEALREPSNAITYHVSRALAQLQPGRALLEGDDFDFDFDRFRAAGRCAARPLDQVHAQRTARWSEDRGTEEFTRNAWYEVEWDGHELDLILMAREDCCGGYYWILAEDAEVARRFHSAVCAFDPDRSGEILVCAGGRFAGSTGLRDRVDRAGSDDLILPDRIHRELFAEATRFFASEATYDRMGVPWKRGLLLLGPPGNGKTHAIRAMIAEAGRPCLYVKTFRSERWTEAECIRRVFERARRAAPCLLVLEDLDALVTEESRSVLLNELDGFAVNRGILAVATTNHPAKLDPAILDRPSRFDRKYHFEPPALAERRAYIARRDGELDPELRLGPGAIDDLAGRTEGFSFAYLKELFLASTLRWIAEPAPFLGVVLAQVEALAEQMKTTEAARLGDGRPSPG